MDPLPSNAVRKATKKPATRETPTASRSDSRTDATSIISGFNLSIGVTDALRQLNVLITQTAAYRIRGESFDPERRFKTPLVDSLVDVRVPERSTKEKVKVLLAKYLLEIRYAIYPSETVDQVLPLLAERSKKRLHVLLVEFAKSRAEFPRTTPKNKNEVPLFSGGGFISTVANGFATLDLLLAGKLEIKDVDVHVTQSEIRQRKSRRSSNSSSTHSTPTQP